MKGKKPARERQKNGAWAARESLPEITRNAFQENFSTVQAIRLVKKSKRVRMFPYSARREHFLLPRGKFGNIRKVCRRGDGGGRERNYKKILLEEGHVEEIVTSLARPASFFPNLSSKIESNITGAV